MEEKMTLYKVAKPILGFIYKLWYNPKIIGKENIPKNGPVVIVGNHVHIMDQCNVILATKRCIHYMAKKEYFDPSYKEGKFPWFFKGVGCIPVDRSKKDEEATNEAINVLKNSEMLGLFPEGTRNSLKEARAKEIYEKYFLEETIDFNEFYKKVKKNKTSFINYLEELKDNKVITMDEFKDNVIDADGFLQYLIKDHRLTREDYYNHVLLPLKFGAVSMAHKTNALIVPYAITGEYKFRSKNLMIRIGEPFTADDDLVKANERLDQEIKNLMKENEQNKW